MLPIRWDPFRDLSSLHREIDELFRRTFGTSGSAKEAGEKGGVFSPLINTYTRDNVFHCEAELPGINKQDLDVNIDGNILTIRGERKMEKESKEEDFLVRESHYGTFVRRMTLPEGVNTEKIHASYEDGMLKITMPMEKKLTTGRKVMISGPEEGKKGKEVH